MPIDHKEQNEKLLQLLKEAVEQDKTLREKYAMRDKFRFIRDRMTALLIRIEESVNATQKSINKKGSVVGEDEALVYVYLFNAQGMVLQTWHKMLQSTVLYEYSVNRPLYLDKSQVESFIRSKPSKGQHGFITIAVKKEHIFAIPQDTAAPKDAIGNPLIKVREGSFAVHKIITFNHNDHEYVLNETGVLVNKPPASQT